MDEGRSFGENVDMSAEGTIARHVREMCRIFRTHAQGETLGKIDALTLEEAYAVQDGFVADRMITSGRIVGWKVGCTSAAIRRQFGLEQPISGRLFEREIASDGAELPLERYVDCAVEPELVFRLGADLKGNITKRQAAQAIETIAVGIELHNYRFWYGTPSSQELIASNGIHAGLIVGRERPWSEQLDLPAETASLQVNGATKASAPCSEIMGGPLRSVQWLSEHAASRGLTLRAGELIIPGSAVELISVREGDSIEARFSTLGSCRARLI
ncbi:MAG TPA: fumarylacetoacetate hydrolase family protein [Chthoniobacterales bacterium]|nr:fumarylacetoacetate hydrolase family protein [Chthoniobacterales bacterium]